MGKEPSLILEFGCDLNLDQAIKDFFIRHFRALVEKAALENHSMEAERLLAELEVASKISSVLVPPKVNYEGLRMKYAVPSNNSVMTILLDHEEIDQIVHFYLAEISVKGTPALMASIHVKAFLKGYRRISSSPAIILGALNDYLLEHKIPDLLLSISYATFCLKESQLTCSTAGHRAFIVNSKSVHSSCLRSGDIPLGIIPDHSFSEAKIKLSDHDIFSIISRTQIQHSIGGSWSQRYEHCMQWARCQNFEEMQSESESNGSHSQFQGYLLIEKLKVPL